MREDVAVAHLAGGYTRISVRQWCNWLPRGPFHASLHFPASLSPNCSIRRMGGQMPTPSTFPIVLNFREGEGERCHGASAINAT